MIYGSAIYATDIYGRVEVGAEHSTGIVSTLFITDVSSQSTRKVTRVSASLLLQDTVEGICSKVSSTVSTFNLNESLTPAFTRVVSIQPSLSLTDFVTTSGIYALFLQDSLDIVSQLRLRHIHKISLDSPIYLDASVESFRGVIVNILAQYSLVSLCSISYSRNVRVSDLVTVDDLIQYSASYSLDVSDVLFLRDISLYLRRILSGAQSEILLDTVASCFLSAIPELVVTIQRYGTTAMIQGYGVTAMIQRYRVTGSVRRR
jgi:hypothetical protein